jgi:hypothetical protein
MGRKGRESWQCLRPRRGSEAAARVAAGARHDARSHGIHWGVLETAMEAVGGSVPVVTGKSAAYERVARQDDGHKGQRVDRAVAATWATASQLCAAALGTGTAGPDANPGSIGTTTGPDRQSHPERSGRYQHQAQPGSQRHSGSCWPRDVGSHHEKAKSTGYGWRRLLAEGCGRRFRSCKWRWRQTSPSSTAFSLGV